MSNPAPWSLQEREALADILGMLNGLDAKTDGWTTKVDARQTGFSLHVRFDRKVGVQDSIAAATVFEQAPIKLCQIVARVLDQLEGETAVLATEAQE